MKIQVKLLGTLSQGVPGYDFEKGLEVHMGDGGRVGDLLVRLKIPPNKARIVGKEGRILNEGDKLEDGTLIHVLQPYWGG